MSWIVPPFRMKDKADKILADFDDACKSLKITYFVFGGTCLGFYRDKGYIKNETDHDIDVGVLCNRKVFDRLIKQMATKNFTYRQVTRAHSHFYRHNIVLDVWYWFHPVLRGFIKSFDTIHHNGRAYNVPHPVEDYLKAWFGNWRVPSNQIGGPR